MSFFSVTDAFAGKLLVHAPPEVALDKSIDAFLHTEALPVIASTKGRPITLIESVFAEHVELELEKVKTTLPADLAVTKPAGLVTVATVRSLEIQVPPETGDN